MEILGIVLVCIGVIIGALNWPLFIRRQVKQSGPSSIPFVGVLFMVLGIMLMPSSNLKSYLWLAPIIDFTAIPMLIFFMFKSIKEKFNSKSNT